MPSDKGSHGNIFQSTSPEAAMTAAPATTSSTIKIEAIDESHSSREQREEQCWSNQVKPLPGGKQDQTRKNNQYSTAPPQVGTERESFDVQSILNFGDDLQPIERTFVADALAQCPANYPSDSDLYRSQHPPYHPDRYSHVPSQDSGTSEMCSNQLKKQTQRYYQQEPDSHSYSQSADHQQQVEFQSDGHPLPHVSIPDISLRETPSSLTECTYNAAMETNRNPFTSSIQQTPLKGILKKERNVSRDVELVNITTPPPFPFLDGDRNPSTSNVPLKGILKRESPQRYQHPFQVLHDFEPIPLREMAAVPALSSSEAISFRYPAYPRITNTVSESHDKFPKISSQTQRLPPPLVFAASQVSPEDQTSPVISSQSKVATQRQKRRARRSSCSTTSSAEGEGSSWERRYNELIEYKRMHNHCDVPQNYPENTSLGTWVNKQRMEHKNRIDGKNSSLNDSRFERLERIGFRWAKRKGQVSWDEKFKELVAYKARFGNCLVPTKYKENTALGRWVSTQRAEYKKYQEGKEKTAMNQDKIQRLESIGFVWFLAL